jgi:hypothetical protein
MQENKKLSIKTNVVYSQDGETRDHKMEKTEHCSRGNYFVSRHELMNSQKVGGIAKNIYTLKPAYRVFRLT